MNEDELAKLLKQIASADKTPQYEYSERQGSGNYLNAAGIRPKPGFKWCTPREICNAYLRDIRIGPLEAAIERLMEVS